MGKGLGHAWLARGWHYDEVSLVLVVILIPVFRHQSFSFWPMLRSVCVQERGGNVRPQGPDLPCILVLLLALSHLAASLSAWCGGLDLAGRYGAGRGRDAQIHIGVLAAGQLAAWMVGSCFSMLFCDLAASGYVVSVSCGKVVCMVGAVSGIGLLALVFHGRTLPWEDPSLVFAWSFMFDYLFLNLGSTGKGTYLDR